MNAANMPTMVGSTASHQAYAAEALFANKAQGAAIGGLAAAGQFQQGVYNPGAQPALNQPLKGIPMSIRRVVQVFVADPNENLSLDDCLLFKGDEKLTDATDQELFFELDIKNMLEIHNAKRVKIVDKKVKDRTEYLEPAKVRDLKMVVVTVANL